MATIGGYSSTPSHANNPKEPVSSQLSTNLMANSLIESDQTQNFETYNEGGTTYFLAGPEMGVNFEINQWFTFTTRNRIKVVLFQGMGDSSTSQARQISAILPNYSVYVESPIEKALKKIHGEIPKQMAKSDFKTEMLKRQYICLAEVSD